MTEAEIKNNLSTIDHINEVRNNLWILIQKLSKRSEVHDKSKLESPESEIFAAHLDKLSKAEYGSEEYKDLLKLVQPAIDHHYSKNTHHPEHFSNGIEGMDLLDLIEMLADWIAATKRVKNGNIHKSIELNKERFKISEQLASILTNTVNRYFN